MSFQKLQWLFPLAVAVHNGEEAIWMPGWDARQAEQLPVDPPSAAVIRLALLVLTGAAFVITYLCAQKGKHSIWAYLLFGSILSMGANVFVPHVPASLIFRAYTPGVVTAVVINLPLMSYLAVLAVRERWVAGWKAAAFGVGVPVGLGGIIVAVIRAA